MAEAALRGFLAVCAAQVERADLDPAELDAADLVTIGVGKAAATLGLLTALREREPAGVLLFGVAGAFRGSQVAPGALCVVGDDGFGDEGVTTPQGFTDLAQLGLGDTGPFAADHALTNAAAARLAVPIVRGVTVSTCSGTDALADERRARTRADVETMEGAAVALVCRELALPLVHVRAISNWTGDRERGEWDLATAASRVQQGVRTLLAR